MHKPVKTREELTPQELEMIDSVPRLNTSLFKILKREHAFRNYKGKWLIYRKTRTDLN